MKRENIRCKRVSMNRIDYEPTDETPDTDERDCETRIWGHGSTVPQVDLTQLFGFAGSEQTGEWMGGLSGQLPEFDFSDVSTLPDGRTYAPCSDTIDEHWSGWDYPADRTTGRIY